MLGALAVALIMITSFMLTTRTLSDKRATAASLAQQASDAETRAGLLKSYTDFSALRQKRVETVRSLAGSRFNWAHTFHELARVLPTSAWLSTVRATTAANVQLDGGSTDPLRNSIASPALEIVGCTKSHDDVARVISDLRRMDGVQRVSLSSATKSDTTSDSGAVSDSGSTADCTRGNAHYPKFSLTVFLAGAQATSASGSESAAATPSAGGTQ
ncbi:MAG TPA: PilN domain-containing protein [Solirubrobacteraceae bacterium]